MCQLDSIMLVIDVGFYDVNLFFQLFVILLRWEIVEETHCVQSERLLWTVQCHLSLYMVSVICSSSRLRTPLSDQFFNTFLRPP